ncbi:TPA: hypothetical protein U2N26_003367 [Acinetobacter nosocomialis]|uniref:hypothetical protein n=1 Tax=Acinetobacter calcoaceticus/baumannii complex TaxID=909768 RepID=UPI000A350664|nr:MULTISPECIES: hypothetical protein [Acinetobacter calcoaceticus/baumannii complex]MBJ8461661.1 hypothetical protein [Acinetobacter nosocomialis]MDV4231021.1 hypothetical protein [Acinetobacter baumannii]OTS36714.1 hypothetical protein CAT07_01545 [Acinetobacter baumannii]HEM7379966.1 hypothetical protein [Acinetobacter nosocomialis]HEM8428985.1 hypothetical protein [Acinetobacter nosocomialis]
MTDLNKEREVNLRFEQDDGVVWVFDGDSQFGTEISHLMMMHADEYSEDELRVICHHAACEIDRLRAELEKAKAQAVPEGYVLLPRVPTEKMLQAYERYSVAPMSTLSKNGYKAMVEAASESGAEK